MREILFRGKVTDGSWIYGNYIYAPGNVEVHSICDPDFPYDWYEVNRHTLEQYTGLIDKNDTKIFEGDIVRTKYGRLCIVAWFSSDACVGWDLIPVDTVENICHKKCSDSYDIYKKDNLEVIGNIHDNPELMK